MFVDRLTYLLQLGAGGLGMEPGAVLMVYNLESARMNCERIFNIFCAYGNILRVRWWWWLLVLHSYFTAALKCRHWGWGKAVHCILILLALLRKGIQGPLRSGGYHLCSCWTSLQLQCPAGTVNCIAVMPSRTSALSAVDAFADQSLIEETRCSHGADG